MKILHYSHDGVTFKYVQFGDCYCLVSALLAYTEHNFQNIAIIFRNFANSHCEFGALARPANDGGAPIRGFWIEKKQRQSLRWVKATKKPSNDLCDKAANLTEGQQYEFRIVAINAAGMSEPRDACAPVLIEDPRRAPEAPKNSSALTQLSHPSL